MPLFDPSSLILNYLPSTIALKILAFCLYILIGRAILLSLANGTVRKSLFVLTNIVALSFVYSLENISGQMLATYLLLMLVLYLVLRIFGLSNKWWIAAIAPIIVLVLGRYAPAVLFNQTLGWIGLSYTAFRLSQLAVIVRNGVTPMPSVLDYMSFACFMPTMFVGPISSYATFHASYTAPNQEVTPNTRCLLRIIIGTAKVLVIGVVCDQLSYRGLLLDKHPHAILDLVIASVAYYLYLYNNFSGFCDIAIGGAGLIGIKVSENFNNPFVARNIKEFWNRWHMTLSGFMRDMVFAPLSKLLVSKLPADMSDHAIAVSIFVVFILIGIWHGMALHYFQFGLVHAFGMVCNYYYGLFLKKRLTKAQLSNYNKSTLIRIASVALTFVFVCASFFLFANDDSQIKEIIKLITWNTFV